MGLSIGNIVELEPQIRGYYGTISLRAIPYNGDGDDDYYILSQLYLECLVLNIILIKLYLSVRWSSCYH